MMAWLVILSLRDSLPICHRHLLIEQHPDQQRQRIFFEKPVGGSVACQSELHEAIVGSRPRAGWPSRSRPPSWVMAEEVARRIFSGVSGGASSRLLGVSQL